MTVAQDVAGRRGLDRRRVGGPQGSSHQGALRWGRRSHPHPRCEPRARRPGRQGWARPVPSRRSAPRASRQGHPASPQNGDPARAAPGRACRRSALPPWARRRELSRATIPPTSCRDRGLRTAAMDLPARETDPRVAPAGWGAGTRARGSPSGGAPARAADRARGQPAPILGRRPASSGRIPAGVGRGCAPRELNAPGRKLVDGPSTTEVCAGRGQPLALCLGRDAGSQHGQDGGQVVEATTVLAASGGDACPPALHGARMRSRCERHHRDRQPADDR